MSFQELPFSVVWYLTDRCNLKCSFCYQEDNRKDYFSIEKCKNALNNIKQLKPFSISLIGGEIFMLDYIYDLIKLINDHGIICNLATNGTLIDRTVVNKLSKLKIGYVQVSIDGTEAIHNSMRGKGAFEKTVNAIRYLREQDFVVHVDPLLCKKNKHEIVDIIRLCESLSVDKMKFNLFFPSGKGKRTKDSYELEEKEIKKLVNQLSMMNSSIELQLPVGNYSYKKSDRRKINKYSCAAGTKKIVILSNGDIVACEFFKDEVVGNIMNVDVYELWRQKTTFSRWRENIILDNLCETCDYLLECRGGCRYLSYLKTGNFHDKYYNCSEE